MKNKHSEDQTTFKQTSKETEVGGKITSQTVQQTGFHFLYTHFQF